MGETEQVVRGAPHFIVGTPGLILVPEAAISADGTAVRPVAVIAIESAGVRRMTLPPARDRVLRPLGLLAALVPLPALLYAALSRGRR